MSNNNMKWCYLIHLGSNMWYDSDAPRKAPNDSDLDFFNYWGSYSDAPVYRDHVICDDETWDKVIEFLPTQGINTIVIDLGEGIQYSSHPELNVKGSWNHEKLKQKLKRVRELGMEPIPKLNFSATHDSWLQQYSRMFSTLRYYEVVADIIEEVCELFSYPRLFHIGMDEEQLATQEMHDPLLSRNADAWWKDFCYYMEQVEKHGARAWCWSDAYCHHSDDFKKRMPKEVLQSFWNYSSRFYKTKEGKYPTIWEQGFVDLDHLGYDQIPTGSNWACIHNMHLMVEMCKKEIAPERLKGFMMAPWVQTTSRQFYFMLDGAKRLYDAKQLYY